MQTESNTNSTAHTIKRVLTIIALIVVVVGIGATVLKLYLSQRYAYQENLNSQLTREKSKLNCYELPLHCAVRDKNLALLNGVARGDALIESLDGWSRSPLYFAITLADKDAIAALLSKGANPNVFNEEGKSALLASIQMKQYEVAKMLLEHGAQVDVEVMAFTENSSLPLYSPLSYCVANNELKCVELLFDHGANIDGRAQKPSATFLEENVAWENYTSS